MDSGTPKKRKCLLFGIDLHQPAEPLPAAEAIQDPPQAPQPQETIKGQYSSPSNFRDKCALFGCQIAPQEGFYCCNNHLQFAELWSSSATKAYQVYDGLLEKDRRELLSFACLLLKLDRVDSGIPTLDTGLVFSKVPWENGDVFGQSHVPTYTSRDWLFFAHPPPVHRTLTSESGMVCQWHGQHHKMRPFDQRYIRSTAHNLLMDRKQEKERRGDWKLYQFVYEGLSLYCLSHVVTPSETKRAQPSSKATKTKAPDSNGDAQGEEGEGSGKRDKNQGKESTTSTTTTSNLGNHSLGSHLLLNFKTFTPDGLVLIPTKLFYLELMKSRSMAASSTSLSARPRQMVSLSRPLTTRLSVSCAAKPETVDKVCEVVKKQLSLTDSDEVTAATKFAALGADSLDTVEFVMGLEEAFEIEMAEERAQSIETVEQAAELLIELSKA